MSLSWTDHAALVVAAEAAEEEEDRAGAAGEVGWAEVVVFTEAEVEVVVVTVVEGLVITVEGWGIWQGIAIRVLAAVVPVEADGESGGLQEVEEDTRAVVAEDASTAGKKGI